MLCLEISNNRCPKVTIFNVISGEGYYVSKLLHVNCLGSRLDIQSTAELLSGPGLVRKPINSNPGLKVNRGINFSCIKMSFTAYVLCSFRLFKLKTEGQTIQTEKLTKKLQIHDQNLR